jgi:hypothetical protein
MNVVIVFRASLVVVRKGLQTTLSFLYPKYYTGGECNIENGVRKKRAGSHGFVFLEVKFH